MGARSLLVATALVLATVAPPAQARGVSAKFLTTGGGLVSDGVRFAAYRRGGDTVRLRDTRRGEAFSIQLARGCSFEPIALARFMTQCPPTSFGTGPSCDPWYSSCPSYPPPSVFDAPKRSLRVIPRPEGYDDASFFRGGKQWLLGERAGRQAPLVYLNWHTNELRQTSDDSPRDLDDPRLRRLPAEIFGRSGGYELIRADSFGSSTGKLRLRGRGRRTIVLSDCDANANDCFFPQLAAKMATWSDSRRRAYLYDLRTGKRYRWHFRRALNVRIQHTATRAFFSVYRRNEQRLTRIYVARLP